MENSRGLATIVVIVAITAFCTVVGLVSKKYMGEDNFVEQGAEKVVDKAIEYEFHLPDGSVNIDFSPDSKNV